jgi:hypothetical protein
VTYTFAGFPRAAGNTVSELIHLDGALVARATFIFNGPSGSNTVPIVVGPGHHKLDARANWDTNGVKGTRDLPGKGGLTCPSDAGFSIEKLQKIEGSGGAFTTSPLSAVVGQTVDYEIIVIDTGNTLLSFSNFTDAHCGAIAGGPGQALAPGDSTTYTCKKLLTGAGSWENRAAATGDPPTGEGSAITHISNTVIVNVPELPIVTPPELPSGIKHSPPGPDVRALKPPTPLQPSPLAAAPPKAPKSTLIHPRLRRPAAVPGLTGPQGCVRSSFVVRMRATGVKSVTFFLDRHEQKKLSAKNVHRGSFTTSMSAARLGVGLHRLVAMITMTQATPSTKTVRASRSLTLVRCASALVVPKFAG